MDDLTLGHHLADQSEAVRVRGDQQARSPALARKAPRRWRRTVAGLQPDDGDSQRGNLWPAASCMTPSELLTP